jgi:hypothetical protein
MIKMYPQVNVNAFKWPQFSLTELKDLALGNELKLTGKRKKEEIIEILEEELPKKQRIILTSPFLTAYIHRSLINRKVMIPSFSEPKESFINEYNFGEKSCLLIEEGNNRILAVQFLMDTPSFFIEIHPFLLDLKGLDKESISLLKDTPNVEAITDFVSINYHLLEEFRFYQVCQLEYREMNFTDLYPEPEDTERKDKKEKVISMDLEDSPLDRSTSDFRSLPKESKRSSKPPEKEVPKRRVIIIDDKPKSKPAETEKKLKEVITGLEKFTFKLTEIKSPSGTDDAPKSPEFNWESQFGSPKAILMKDYEVILKKKSDLVDVNGCCVKIPLTNSEKFLMEYSFCQKYLKDRERPDLEIGMSSKELRLRIEEYSKNSISHGICCLAMLETGITHFQGKQDLEIERDLRADSIVYILEQLTPWSDEKTRIIKVGYSAVGVESRMKSLKTGAAFPLKELTWTHAIQEAETRLKARLLKYSTGGGEEWYRLTTDQVNKLLSLPKEAQKRKMKLEDLVAGTYF